MAAEKRHPDAAIEDRQVEEEEDDDEKKAEVAPKKRPCLADLLEMELGRAGLEATVNKAEKDALHARLRHQQEAEAVQKVAKRYNVTASVLYGTNGTNCEGCGISPSYYTAVRGRSQQDPSGTLFGRVDYFKKQTTKQKKDEDKKEEEKKAPSPPELTDKRRVCPCGAGGVYFCTPECRAACPAHAKCDKKVAADDKSHKTKTPMEKEALRQAESVAIGAI
jgi:hypothetical protein